MEEKGNSPFLHSVAVKGDYPMDVVLRATGGILQLLNVFFFCISLSIICIYELIYEFGEVMDMYGSCCMGLRGGVYNLGAPV